MPEQSKLDVGSAVPTRSGIREGRDRVTATSPLSKREIEVVKLLCSGRSIKETAAILDIADKTVAAHSFNIYHKLEVHSRIDLLLKAVQLGYYVVPLQMELPYDSFLEVK